MLEQIYNEYRKKAEVINWKDYNINELFFEYIKNENEPISENFFAGIVCRTWGYAGRVYVQCNRHVTFEECYDCLIDTLRYVLNKRVWENPESSLYGDQAAPDKAFHIALKRQRGIMLSRLNAYRRRSNFNVLSLDGVHEEFNDATDGLLFDMESSEIDNIRIFISEYFEKGETLSGLLLDVICYNNYSGYDEKKVIKSLRDLDDNYFEYYHEYYNLDENIFKKTVRTIQKLSTRSIKMKLKSLLFKLKKEGLFGD